MTLKQYDVSTVLLRLNQMLYALGVCHATPTQKLFSLHVFHQAGSPQQV